MNAPSSKKTSSLNGIVTSDISSSDKRRASLSTPLSIVPTDSVPVSRMMLSPASVAEPSVAFNRIFANLFTSGNSNVRTLTPPLVTSCEPSSNKIPCGLEPILSPFKIIFPPTSLRKVSIVLTETTLPILGP